MLIPLIVLATGAGLSGYIGYSSFVGHNAAQFWGDAILVLDSHPALEAAHHVPSWVKFLPLGVGFGGILLAFIFYMWAPGIPALIVGKIRPFYNFIHNKWYFDELYNFLFVKPAFYLGRNLWKTVDGAIIDGIGPDGISAVTLNLAKRIAQLQTGYLYHYAFAMIGGIIILITTYMWLGV
jgi:NADH-quinone oxidoreductase subunit L